MAEANKPREVIAAKLDRSVSEIMARSYTIGLPLKWFKQSSSSEGDGEKVSLA